MEHQKKVFWLLGLWTTYNSGGWGVGRYVLMYACICKDSRLGGTRAHTRAYTRTQARDATPPELLRRVADRRHHTSHGLSADRHSTQHAHHTEHHRVALP